MQFLTQHTLSFKMMYDATCYPSGMGTCHFWCLCCSTKEVGLARMLYGFNISDTEFYKVNLSKGLAPILRKNEGPYLRLEVAENDLGMC